MGLDAELAEFNARHARYDDAALDATGLCGDWRTFKKIKGSSHEVPVASKNWCDSFRRIRESGEAALAQLTAVERKISSPQLKICDSPA